MMSYTHSVFGILLFLMVGGLLDVYPAVWLLAVVALSALLPDIDHPRSILGMILFPVSNFVFKKWGHRTITHSAKFLLFVGLCSAPVVFVRWELWLAIFIGVLSHLIGDGFTVSGVPLQYPNTRPFYFLPESMLIKTSGSGELGMFIVIVVVIAIFGGVTFMGFRSIIHNIIPSFDGTVSEYGKYCEGVGDKQICRISAYTCGEYCGEVDGLILGIYNYKLIVYDDSSNRYFELSRGETTKAKLVKGEEVYITHMRVEFKNSNFELEDFDGLVTISGYLYGEFNCVDSAHIYPVFSVDSNSMKFHSARFEDIQNKNCVGFVKSGSIEYKIRK